MWGGGRKDLLGVATEDTGGRHGEVAKQAGQREKLNGRQIAPV